MRRAESQNRGRADTLAKWSGGMRGKCGGTTRATAEKETRK